MRSTFFLGSILAMFAAVMCLLTGVDYIVEGYGLHPYIAFPGVIGMLACAMSLWQLAWSFDDRGNGTGPGIHQDFEDTLIIENMKHHSV